MIKDQAAVVLTLFVWGLAGALFGGIFAGLYQVLVAMGIAGWQPLVIGTAAAAMTTSAFYSAMPVALVGVMGGVLASIGYLMATGNRVELHLICVAATVAGLLAGSFYSWVVKGGAQPLAKTLAGLLAGLAAGGLVWEGLALYGRDVDLSVLTAGVVAVVGGLFKVSERWIVRTFSGRCPRTLSAPVVAGLIAAVVGAGVWILASALDAAANGAFGRVLHELPAGFLGGMLGGLVTGALLEILGIPLMDDEHLV